jgi:hypothetical protein
VVANAVDYRDRSRRNEHGDPRKADRDCVTLDVAEFLTEMAVVATGTDMSATAQEPSPRRA